MIDLLLNHPFLLLFTALGGWLVYKFVIKLYIMRAQLPPGPFPLPLIGNILSFRGIQRNTQAILAELMEKQGDTATFFTGPTPMVVLSSVESIRENLIDNPHDFQSRPQFPMNYLWLKGEQDIVYSPYNELWKLHKKIAAKAMKKIIDSEHLSNHVHTIVSDLVDLMTAEGGDVKLADYTTSITFSVLMHFCFGERRSFNDEIFQKRLEMQQRKTKIFTSAMKIIFLLPGSYYFFKYCTFYKPVRDMHAFFDAMDSFTDTRVKQHKANFNPEIPPEDIVNAVLLEQYEMQKNGESFEKMKDAHVSLLITDIFEAGVKTTSTTLQWFFLEMVIEPEVQRRCQEQIDEVLGNRHPKLADRINLPYVEACIVEVLRMHPPVPFGVPTTPSNPNAIFNKCYRLPEDTMIATNLLSLHYNEKYFEKPMDFKPERFLGERGVLKPPAWLPFGCGKRVCLGEQLAKNDLFLIITGLLQRLKFEKVPAMDYHRDPAVKDTNYVPRENYQFVITRR